MEQYDDIFEYLQNNTYPEGLSKDSKRNWRHKCTENYKIQEGQLFHRKSTRSKSKEQKDESEWKRCVRTQEEKERMLKSCHSSATGR